MGGREWLSRPVEQWDLEDLLLAHGAAIIAEKRAKVYHKLGYTVSAGMPSLERASSTRLVAMGIAGSSASFLFFLVIRRLN